MPTHRAHLGLANRASVFLTTLLLGLTACAAPPITPTPEATLTPTLPDCVFVTAIPAGTRLLPEFTPDCPCDLENASARVDDCLVHAAPDQVYPCSRSESVSEVVLAETEKRRLIQRDAHTSAGCWTGFSHDVRTLRLCEVEDGTSRVVGQPVWGDPVAAPDGGRWAYVVAGPENDGLAAHLLVLDLDTGEPIQLDTRQFPQDSVVGAKILGWSSDDVWLEVTLWDGHVAGYHGYRLRTDGSGVFERLP